MTDEPDWSKVGPRAREAIEMAALTNEVKATRVIESVEKATGLSYEEGIVKISTDPAFAEVFARLQADLAERRGIALEIDRQLAQRRIQP